MGLVGCERDPDLRPALDDLHHPAQWSSATCFTTHFSAERLRTLLSGSGRPGKALAALELGCGTGLAGLYCASLGAVDHVTLSDCCPTVERLARGNIARNQLQGRASFARLDWRWVLEEHHPLPWPRGAFDLLLVCDGVYEAEGGGRCLPRIVEQLLAPGGVFLLTLPLRPNYQGEVALFDGEMGKLIDMRLEEEQSLGASSSDLLDHRVSVYRRAA